MEIRWRTSLDNMLSETSFYTVLKVPAAFYSRVERERWIHHHILLKTVIMSGLCLPLSDRHLARLFLPLSDRHPARLFLPLTSCLQYLHIEGQVRCQIVPPWQPPKMWFCHRVAVHLLHWLTGSKQIHCLVPSLCTVRDHCLTEILLHSWLFGLHTLNTDLNSVS